MHKFWQKALEYKHTKCLIQAYCTKIMRKQKFNCLNYYCTHIHYYSFIDQETCATCGATSKNVKKCSKCKKVRNHAVLTLNVPFFLFLLPKVWYCNVDCQRLSWSVGNHKKLCKIWSAQSQGKTSN